MDLAAQVKTNLVHYNLWHDVHIHDTPGLKILSGIPPNKLGENDKDNQVEWVVPQTMDSPEVLIDDMELWFEAVSRLCERPKRVTIAIANDDGTIVYYFVHDGAVKPRQN